MQQSDIARFSGTIATLQLDVQKMRVEKSELEVQLQKAQDALLACQRQCDRLSVYIQTQQRHIDARVALMLKDFGEKEAAAKKHASEQASTLKSKLQAAMDDLVVAETSKAYLVERLRDVTLDLEYAVGLRKDGMELPEDLITKAKTHASESRARSKP